MAKIIIGCITLILTSPWAKLLLKRKGPRKLLVWHLIPHYLAFVPDTAPSRLDFELLEVLDNEIRYEKEELQTATSRIMEGYTMKASGSQVYLTKKYGVETIKV